MINIKITKLNIINGEKKREGESDSSVEYDRALFQKISLVVGWVVVMTAVTHAYMFGVQFIKLPVVLLSPLHRLELISRW